VAEKPSVDDVLERARSQIPTTASRLSTERILEHRDAERK
jgi:hypothetical protein